MPIYEYRCQDCGHELEKLQKLSDAPLVDCPACAKPALTKLVSAAGFRLKGGGWYETDFKKDGKRNLVGDADGAKKDSGAETTKSDGKSESKPTETKSDTKPTKSAADKAA